MILKSFRIKNYRSILDTGWNNLSPDNVTALIGQNESGKTSVLEALKSFFDGKITDDILRSDLSIPEISCIFHAEASGELLQPGNRFPEGVRERINETGQIYLTRTWSNLTDSRLVLEGDELIELYSGYDNIWQNLEDYTSGTTDKYSKKNNALLEEIESLEQQVNNVRKSAELLTRKAGEIERQLRKTRDNTRKELLEKEAARIDAEISELEKKNERIANELKTIREELNSTGEILNKSARCQELQRDLITSMEKMDYSYGQLMGAENLLAKASTNREYRKSLKKVEQFKNLYIQLNNTYGQIKRDYRTKQLELKQLLSGKDEFESARLATEEYVRLENIISREEVAELFYEKIPQFELFEDFSSLLPNRIDLEDLFLEHTGVEG